MVDSIPIRGHTKRQKGIDFVGVYLVCNFCFSLPAVPSLSPVRLIPSTPIYAVTIAYNDIHKHHCHVEHHTVFKETNTFEFK